MQNDFEKQVQQKMDELKFTPSQPVWQNIEEAIREKKERRRILLWLPLYFLIFGVTVFLLYPFEKQASRPSRIETTAVKTVDVSTPEEANDQRKETKNADVIHSEAKAKVHSKKYTSNPVTSLAIAVSRVKTNTGNANTFNSTSNQQDHQQKTTGSIRPGRSHNADKPEIASATSQTESTIEKSVAGNTSSGTDGKTDSAVATQPPAPTEPETSELKKDEAKPVVKLQQARKWNFGLTSTLGFYDMVNGTQGGGLRATTQGGSISIASPAAPTAPDRAISYSFGILARKPLNDRLHVTIGIAYRYYSTKVRTGPVVKLDTVLNNGYASTRVSAYYPPASSSAITIVQEYSNRFHLISVPLWLDYQPFPNLPLIVQGGVSINRLISTNALINSYDNRTLYRNDDAFSKTLFFTEAGLQYQFLKRSKISVMAGPRFQYGVNSIYTEGANTRHLYSLGIQANVWFGKNR